MCSSKIDAATRLSFFLSQHEYFFSFYKVYIVICYAFNIKVSPNLRAYDNKLLYYNNLRKKPCWRTRHTPVKNNARALTKNTDICYASETATLIWVRKILLWRQQTRHFYVSFAALSRRSRSPGRPNECDAQSEWRGFFWDVFEESQLVKRREWIRREFINKVLLLLLLL
jgi:hypothetical protein